MLDQRDEMRAGKTLRWMVNLGVIVFTLALGWAILSLPDEAPGLFREVEARLGDSGVDSRVTAVLLNFRAYDTFLEVAVLLVAVLGLRAIRLGSREPLPESPDTNPLLSEFLLFFVPIMIVIAGYLLWAGSKYPGGAFQAGAVLGAAGVLLHIGGRLPVGGIRALTERGLLAVGVVVFGGIGALCMLWGGAFLEYPQAWAKPLILIIETAGAISIAATFVVLFVGRSLATINDAALEENGGKTP